MKWKLEALTPDKLNALTAIIYNNRIDGNFESFKEEEIESALLLLDRKKSSLIFALILQGVGIIGDERCVLNMRDA